MRTRTRSVARPTGFTIVELVVVVGIVAVGLALALPGVHHARESARLAKCKDNLKRLGMALHSYHETHDRFPFSGSYSITGKHLPGVGHTWNEFLFPYMGLSDVYLKLDFRVPNQDGPNAKLLELRKLPWQCCPSNEYSEKMQDLAGNPFDPWKVGTQGQFYALCTGTQMGDGGTGWDCQALGLGPGSFCCTQGSDWDSPAPAANPGMFGGRNPFSAALRDVADGTSVTFLLRERRAELLFWGGGAFSPSFPGAPTIMKLNSKLINPADARDFRHNWGFSSRHEGGAHFLFVDGHVRFINEAIDYETYCRLSDKADGNKIMDY
jgi:prepilin-type processing-associated H-X9-DG protein/prepilin-type N-terminal cleavage/methylation domain-containing protein